MAASHITGNSAGVRQGCIPAVHSLKLAYNSALNRKFLRIVASATKPVLLIVREVGSVAFVGGTPPYSLGTTSGGADVAAGRNSPAPGTSAEVTLLKQVFKADTDLWVKLTTTSITSGEAYVLAELIELNVSDVNANAIP